MNIENKSKLQKLMTLIAMGLSLTAAQAAQAQSVPAPQHSQVVLKAALGGVVVGTGATVVNTAIWAVGSSQGPKIPLLRSYFAPHSLEDLKQAMKKVKSENMTFTTFRSKEGLKSTWTLGTDHALNSPYGIRAVTIENAEEQLAKGSKLISLERQVGAVEQINHQGMMVGVSAAATFGSFLLASFEACSNDKLSELILGSRKISSLQEKTLHEAGAKPTSHSVPVRASGL